VPTVEESELPSKAELEEGGRIFAAAVCRCGRVLQDPDLKGVFYGLSSTMNVSDLYIRLGTRKKKVTGVRGVVLGHHNLLCP